MKGEELVDISRIRMPHINMVTNLGFNERLAASVV
jgi:hypothetical protein